MATTTIRTPSEGGNAGAKRNTTNPVAPPAPVQQPTIQQPNLEGIFGSAPGSGDGGAAGRAAALKGVDIEKRRIEFQKTTGLRDIEQARDEGLRGAINNALQRGVYRSGIRVGNEEKVNRESDEASGDLKTDIAFALELLTNRASQIKAGGGAGGVSGFGFNFDEFNKMMEMRDSWGYLPPTPPAPLRQPAAHEIDPNNRGMGGR